MVVNVLNIIAKEHQKWLRIARSFGLDDTAEDLVQDMYLKIHDWKGKYDKTLMFNETEVNHYFIFLVLRNLFLDLCRANKKKAAHSSANKTERSTRQIGLEYKEQLEMLKDEISSWHLYDRKIYELLYQEGYSMLELSKQTGIDYYSIYRTKNKIQKLLNQKLEK